MAGTDRTNTEVDCLRDLQLDILAQPLHDEVGPTGAVWIFPRVPPQHDDLRDPPLHGHQGGDGLPRQGQHLSSAVTNNAQLTH